MAIPIAAVHMRQHGRRRTAQLTRSAHKGITAHPNGVPLHDAEHAHNRRNAPRESTTVSSVGGGNNGPRSKPQAAGVGKRVRRTSNGGRGTVAVSLSDLRTKLNFGASCS